MTLSYNLRKKKNNFKRMTNFFMALKITEALSDNYLCNS